MTKRPIDPRSFVIGILFALSFVYLPPLANAQEVLERDFFEPGTVHFLDGSCIDTDGEWGITSADTCWTPADHAAEFGADVPVGWDQDKTFDQYITGKRENLMTPALQEARIVYAQSLRLQELESLNDEGSAVLTDDMDARRSGVVGAVPYSSITDQHIYEHWVSRYAPRPARRTVKVANPGGSVPPPAPGVEQWRSLVSQYSWDADEALNVIRCESNGVATARRPGGTDSGLFQIVKLWWGPAGIDPFDPEQNVALAYEIWLQGHPRAGAAPNWGMWVCQPDGSYWRF